MFRVSDTWDWNEAAVAGFTSEGTFDWCLIVFLSKVVFWELDSDVDDGIGLGFIDCNKCSKVAWISEDIWPPSKPCMSCSIPSASCLANSSSNSAELFLIDEEDGVDRAGTFTAEADVADEDLIVVVVEVVAFNDSDNLDWDGGFNGLAELKLSKRSITRRWLVTECYRIGLEWFKLVSWINK